jgi:hypothetical protein
MNNYCPPTIILGLTIIGEVEIFATLSNGFYKAAKSYYATLHAQDIDRTRKITWKPSVMNWRIGSTRRSRRGS